MGIENLRNAAMKKHFQIKLDVFSGPFDLLLHLIQKHQIDIYDIPIAQIADEFVDYLKSCEWIDVELAGDFLVMAATLMQIKARMLLPRPRTDSEAEEPEDPRSELVERLLEYKCMKEAAAVLRDRLEYWDRIFTRDVDEVIFGSSDFVPTLGGVTASDLAKALAVALSRVTDAGEVSEHAVISRDGLTLAQAVQKVRLRLMRDRKVSFFSLFDEHSTREIVIAMFLAVLELIRLGEVIAEQSGPFCDILLVLTSSRGGERDEPH